MMRLIKLTKFIPNSGDESKVSTTFVKHEIIYRVKIVNINIKIYQT